MVEKIPAIGTNLVRPLSAARRMAAATCQFGGIRSDEEGVQYVKAGKFLRRRILTVIQ